MDLMPLSAGCASQDPSCTEAFLHFLKAEGDREVFDPELFGEF